MSLMQLPSSFPRMQALRQLPPVKEFPTRNAKALGLHMPSVHGKFVGSHLSRYHCCCGRVAHAGEGQCREAKHIKLHRTETKASPDPQASTQRAL